MPILDHFGCVAPFYDRLASAPDAALWKERLELPTSGYLLDAGGGTGRISAPLRRWTGGVIVADPSLAMARQSSAKTGLSAVRGEAERLPFADHFFERILMVDAFHHVRSQPETAAELVRVLKPGGRLLVAEPDIRYFGVRLIALAEKLLLMRSHFYAAGQALALFERLPVKASLSTEGWTYFLLVEKNVP